MPDTNTLKVDKKYRTNPLSQIYASGIIIVKYNNGKISEYDNIHRYESYMATILRRKGKNYYDTVESISYNGIQKYPL